MFWKYNTTNSNHLEALLSKPDLTLQELLDDEDILQECKVQNKKLIDFLCRPEVMEQLVTYTTVEPPADLNEKIRFKYPNVACELLTSDIPAINEHLAADEPLSKLYAFLEGEPPLNPLLASFFSKTLGILVARKSEQNWYLYQITCLKVLQFLQLKENCIPLLLNHLGTSAIMDLMLKLITQMEGTDIRQNLINWFETQSVIPSLIALLKPDVDSERHCNVSQLLSDVIRKSRENLMNSPDPDPILITLEKQETVAELLDHMLSGETKSESGIVGGIGVLLTLIEVPQPRIPETTYTDETVQVTQEEEIPPPSPPVPPVVHTTIAAILPRLKDFHALLLNPPQKPPVKTTVGTLDPPLGNTRLQVARLVAALIAVNNPAINQELANLGTIEVLLDLFFKYQWNNFLHTQVEQCIASALKHQTKASGEGDPQVHCLVENLLVKCDLLRRILDAWEENEANQSKEKSQRRGYMGHLIKIANLVVDQVAKCSLRPILVKQLSPEVLGVWEEFVSCTLSEINKTHNIALGGAPPLQSMELDKEEANYKHVAFQPDTSQAFADYQVQEMAPGFTENYGFHDNEFNDPEDTLHSSVDRLPEMSVALNEDVDRQYEWFKHVCTKNLRSLEDAEESAWEDTNLGSFQTSENESSRWKMDKDQSSSDEEEEDDDKEENEMRRPTKSDTRMDVDVNDIWSSGAATLDTIADFQNPWGSTGPAPVPAAEAFGSSDAGWADFSSFETNFSSSTQLNDGQKSLESAVFGGGATVQPVSDSGDKEVHEEKFEAQAHTIEKESPETKDSDEPELHGSESKPNSAGVSFMEADANANPTSSADDVTSTATAMVDEVATAAVAAVRVVVADKLGLDNQRFLGVVQNDSETAAQNDSEAVVDEPVPSEEAEEQREVEGTVADDLSSKSA
ncbi:serine/threonine-protein phosphatase 6 regulatory subunit 3 isoform X1 [Frankliniella occidentalis]|uniref:Serine/threonine-protein phosphatase 6 regulatory subunit 3 isoform X1 n=1 Tax=Frankliniella occidentalis TaxID=133901 RepID=A0A6J1SRP1_FRAOC|nr:serine/threonine-protein phosphatase 6 regulatory subunit 3 isoform X1 [Frankliniella occidentalis]